MWFLISCGQVREQLSALDDGELRPLERLRIRGHLVICRRCASVRRGLRATRVALASLRDETV